MFLFNTSLPLKVISVCPWISIVCVSSELSSVMLQHLKQEEEEKDEEEVPLVQLLPGPRRSV